MEYVVDIENFDGPLDLLLHLVKESKFDIMDVDLVLIANQYLEYIKKYEQVNLDLASEYLVVAAELVELKSYLLLPKKEQEEFDEEEEENPEERIRKALLEYARYKSIAESLRDYESERKTLFSKEAFSKADLGIDDNEVNETFEMNDLLEAFNNMLKRKQKEKPLSTKIANKEYSVNERSKEIKKVLLKKKKVEFSELFDSFKKDYVVVTFLSILDMSKHKEININQEKNFDKIFIELSGGTNE